MSAETDKKVAIIQVGASQHLVRVGQKISANRLDLEAGQKLELGDKLTDQKVVLKVLSHLRGPKINGLKFKNKVRYIRRYGHRQELTSLEVMAIGTKAEQKTEAKTAGIVSNKPAAKTTAKKPTVKKVTTAKTKKVGQDG